MRRPRLTLDNGSHYDPFLRMKNTLRSTIYVVPVGVGTADLTTVFPRNVRSIVSNFVDSPGAGGAGLFLAIFYINNWINLSIGDGSGALGLLTRRTEVSAWLSHTLHRSTMSRRGVSGGRQSKCRRSSQLSCLAINRSRINLRRSTWPMSPNALTANVSKAIAKLEGSSPGFRTVLSNYRR